MLLLLGRVSLLAVAGRRVSLLWRRVACRRVPCRRVALLRWGADGSLLLAVVAHLLRLA